jgi:hypothetical protein
LVFGDGPNHVFQVEIEKAKTVAALKDAIKSKNQEAFGHIDARSLVLWAVSIPVDRELAQKLSNLGAVDERSLSPVDKLSTVFSDEPMRGSLHIVVKSSVASEYELLVVVTLLTSTKATNLVLGL